VVPVSAIVCLEGFNFLTQKLSGKVTRYVATVVVIIMVLWITIKEILPVGLSTEDKVVKNSADWIRQSNLETHKFYYFSPYFSLFLDRDIFDNTQNEEPWAIHEKEYRKGIPAGSLLIWDSHFSANEGKTPLRTLTDDNSFNLLNKFQSDKVWTDLNKEKKYFEIYVFQKK
jgi:hypothetical protein